MDSNTAQPTTYWVHHRRVSLSTCRAPRQRNGLACRAYLKAKRSTQRRKNRLLARIHCMQHCTFPFDRRSAINIDACHHTSPIAAGVERERKGGEEEEEEEEERTMQR